MVMMLSMRCLFDRTAALMSSINFAIDTESRAFFFRCSAFSALCSVANIWVTAIVFSSEALAQAAILAARTDPVTALEHGGMGMWDAGLTGRRVSACLALPITHLFVYRARCIRRAVG